MGKRKELFRSKRACHALYELTDGKDYFVVTTVTDARIFDSPLRADRITAPCGNVNWFQCSEACTKDIWERGRGAGRTLSALRRTAGCQYVYRGKKLYRGRLFARMATGIRSGCPIH